MKRIIILLLVLSCFRFSYAEELTTEQQQLAWNLIMHNFSHRDYRPNTFKTDIVINLKGEVTSEDSAFVKSLIPRLQVAIPSLKIKLSENVGNFILALNDGKRNTKNTNMKASHELSSVGIYLPVPENLNKKEREQFIYFHFLQGLTSFFYSKPSFAGLEGCVFTEKDFRSVTFSHVDLYIIQQLYSHDFPVLLAKNLDSEMQQTAWKSIQRQFMGEPNDPVIFQSNILIRLAGEFSQQDSLIFKKLINELNKLLPAKNQFVFGQLDANLSFYINRNSGAKIRESNRSDKNYLKKRDIELNILEDANDEQRLKIIYYYLYRSLVHFSPAYGGSQKVPGCVFDEDKPEDITFHPIDKFIVSKLYAPDFQDQFKAYFVKASSLREYYKFRYSDRLAIIRIAGGLILVVLLISILILLNVFRKHNWKFRSFLVQVIWGIIVFNVFFFFNNLVQYVGIAIDSNTIISIICEDLTILIVSVASFYIEKRIHFSTVSTKRKFLLQLLNTVVISYIFIFLILRFLLKESGYNLLFYPIFITLIITIARFFMISLSVLSRAEIKQKDNELILLKEKNKQAELQSLRAKINPHFLYNALNSIASLATTDARKTEQMALALSDFFKYAINREQKQLNTLSEELNAIRTYLEIEKVRFGDRLNFEIDCPTELLEIQIPQLLIQPLVENAIKHGLSQITENGLIRILVSRAETQLKIRVYDNGPSFPDGPLSGFGIQNTQERITLLYGTKATINWQNGEEKYVEISLPL